MHRACFHTVLSSLIMEDSLSPSRSSPRPPFLLQFNDEFGQRNNGISRRNIYPRSGSSSFSRLTSWELLVANALIGIVLQGNCYRY